MTITLHIPPALLDHMAMLATQLRIPPPTETNVTMYLVGILVGAFDQTNDHDVGTALMEANCTPEEIAGITRSRPPQAWQ